MFVRLKEIIKRDLMFLYGYIVCSCKKNNQFDACNLPLIEARRFKFYANTPNTIIRFEGQSNGFFRECRQHLPHQEYLLSLFSDYCLYVYVNDHSNDCFNILKAYVNTKNWKRFFNMGEGTARYSRINLYRDTRNPIIFGFEDDLPDWFYQQLPQLVQFAWGPLMEYRYCRGLRKGAYQTFNSSKTIVSKIVADVLGASTLIPNTYYARLIIDGNIRVGVIVETARGFNPNDCNYEIKLSDISPIFQKNLIDLWLLDIITYQKDHRPGNYFVDYNERKKIEYVSAFDNDCPTTLFPTSDINFKTYTGITSLISKDGTYRLPFISKSIYGSIVDVDLQKVEQSLFHYCSYIEKIMLLKRLKKVRDAIYKSVSNGKTKVLYDDEWSKDTIDKELDFEEITYLSYFYKNNISKEQ